MLYILPFPPRIRCCAAAVLKNMQTVSHSFSFHTISFLRRLNAYMTDRASCMWSLYGSSYSNLNFYFHFFPSSKHQVHWKNVSTNSHNNNNNQPSGKYANLVEIHHHQIKYLPWARHLCVIIILNCARLCRIDGW